MPPFIGFLIENSIVNSIPIFLGALVFAYIAGPFLKNVGANNHIRISVYSIIGVAVGMWSYSSYDIPDRSIELVEAFALFAGMLIYAMLIIAPIVLLTNRSEET